MTEHSAGVIPIRRTGHSILVLVLRAYRYWDFPKGRVEEGELPLDTARREAREEAGLEDLELAWGLQSYRTEPYGRNKVAEYFIAETQTEQVVLGVSLELGRPEHHEARWCTFERASALLNDRVRGALHWAQDIVTAGDG